MRKLLTTAATLSLLGIFGAGTAHAIGGSEVNRHIKEENAYCDKQRRGEAPPYPNFCLPELPLPSDQAYRNRPYSIY